MQPTHLKKTAPIDMYSKLENYVLSNYSMGMLSDNVDHFFRDIKQNRDVICKLSKNISSVDQLTQHRLILTTYLNEILALKSKMTFGKQSYSCKIGFCWTDTICKKEWKSYNIYFEIYNCLYNLGVIYYLLGNHLGNTAKDDKNINKEAVKNYKHALFIFDRLKNEAYSAINIKELPYDLYPSHLKYLSKLCIIFGQVEIIEVAQIISKNEFNLQAKLYKGISETLKVAFSLSNQKPTSKGGKPEFRAYLSNRIQYYRGLMYYKLKEGAQKKFNDKGVGYGEALVFQGKYVKKLLECQKTLQECGQYIDIKAFNEKLKVEKELGQKMLDLNNRIYRQPTNEDKNFKIESKILMNPVLPDDLYIGKNKDKAKEDGENLCPELDYLIPSQTKEMIDRYKQRMSDFLQQNISQYETEKSINSFLQNLHLPNYLTKRRTGETLNQGSISLPPQLWDKISQVQQLGGTVALNDIMSNIHNKYNYLVSNLENTLNSFKNEENDDNMNRQKYGSKWIRKSSNVLNVKFIQAIQNHLKNLQGTCIYDQKMNDDICNNAKYFEKISCSKAKLTNDIPGRVVGKKPENSNESQLHDEILNLYDLSDKTNDIISPIYDQLNDDSAVLSMFVEVLEKNTTEQAIFNKNKEDYEKKFNELKEISEQILNQKKVINDLASKVVPEMMKKQKDQNVGDETMEYFKELDKYANLYLNMYDKCKKGEDYYNNLQYKVDEVLAASNKWMIRRNEEKNALISTITKGQGNTRSFRGQNTQFQDEMAFLNPSENMYTNFNVNSSKNTGNYGGGY